MSLEIYDEARSVPNEAQKTIKGGRLSGMTDINPMWRIKKLTELFGPCGFGWKYEIAEKRLEKGSNDEIAAFVDINLYIKHEGEWSEAIPGTGGSTFVANEKKGLYMSDECFKMALTDAIGIACKALGFAADVYWDSDRTKYDNNNNKGTTKNYDNPGEIVLTFGKNKGSKLKDLDDGYLKWLAENANEESMQQAAQSVLDMKNVNKKNELLKLTGNNERLIKVVTDELKRLNLESANDLPYNKYIGLIKTIKAMQESAATDDDSKELAEKADKAID